MGSGYRTLEEGTLWSTVWLCSDGSKSWLEKEDANNCWDKDIYPRL